MIRNRRIRVEQIACVGDAMCKTLAPKVFRLNANRRSAAVDPAGDSQEKILEATDNCPVSAISVENAETEEELCP